MKKILLLTLLLSPIVTFAQKYVISGKVIQKNREPISMALVGVNNTNNYVLTNAKGEFELKVSKGKIAFVVSSMDYKSFEHEYEINGDIKDMIITLSDMTLAVDDVIVTSKATQSKEGTSSYKIGKEAIKQVQAISLSDIVQLLPGNRFTPPKLNTPAQINIRNAGNATSPNAFGTSIIIDGVALSNDANMQAQTPALGSSGGTNVVNRGVDLREISASNIESVEVITGVAGAKYGNITSGTVLVTRKAGYSPLQLSFNGNPSTYQLSASKGVKVNDKLGFINIDVDYTFSNSKPTDIAEYFERISSSVRWTATIVEKLNWSNTISFSYGTQGDREKYDADKTVPSKRDVKNNRYAASVNGRLKLLGDLTYSAGVNYADQYSMFETLADGPVPLVESTTEGTFFTSYSPLKFSQTTIIEGAPININGRIEANHQLTTDKINFNFSAGIDLSYDKNRGKGRVFSGAAVLPSNMPGNRKALFHEIPASSNIALYHEADMRYSNNYSQYLLRIGARYDYMNNRYSLLSPRLSFSAKYFDAFRVRAAWGISYKAPSMLSLYPGPVYFDVTNLSYYHNEPIRRLAIVTTYIHQPTNEHLKPSKGDTKEIGFDFEKYKWNLRVTGYVKKLTRGITTYNMLKVIEKQNYKVVNEPEGMQPEVEKSNVVYLPRTFSAYSNNSESTTKGVEFTLEPPKIVPTNTSFQFSGSYMKTKSYDNVPSLRSSQINVSTEGSRYGVYDNTKDIQQLSVANLTLIQHLPRLRMLVTFVTEFNFINKRGVEVANLYPVGYYGKKGDYIPLSLEEAKREDYKDLVLSENVYSFNNPPFYTNYHLQIRKETKQGHSFSFYANNCLWYNPQYTYSAGNSKVTLNGRISFGFGASFKLF